LRLESEGVEDEDEDEGAGDCYDCGSAGFDCRDGNVGVFDFVHSGAVGDGLFLRFRVWFLVGTVATSHCGRLA
jgi:hypothetical protein